MFIAGESNPCCKTGENKRTVDGDMYQGPLKGLQTHFSNLSQVNKELRGKAAKEFAGIRQRGLQTVETIKSKVKEEIKQYELKEAARNDREKEIQHHDHKSKQVIGYVTHRVKASRNGSYLAEDGS